MFLQGFGAQLMTSTVHVLPSFLQCLSVLVDAQDPEITENILPEIKRMGVTGRLFCTVINKLDNPVRYYVIVFLTYQLPV